MTQLADHQGLAAEAIFQLCAQIGSLAQQLEKDREERIEKARRMRQLIRPIPTIPIPQITSTNGVADYPELLSPRTGFWWDVHNATVNTFSAGSVQLYLMAGGSGGGMGGALADTNQVYNFSTKGALTFGKAQLMVPPGLRLVFSATGITGNASPSIRVTEVHNSILADYLL